MTDEKIASACLTYRHDFGLLADHQRAELMAEARRWAKAFEWEFAEREAALRAEVERLKAAIDMQPSPPTREDMEWAGKVHLAEAEKENDALRAEVEALRAALNTIARTPAMPFPDPIAHSARAYHEAVFMAWSRSNQIARAALARAKDAEAR